MRAFFPDLLKLPNHIKQLQKVLVLQSFPKSDDFFVFSKNRTPFIVRNAFQKICLNNFINIFLRTYPDASCQIRTGDYFDPKNYAQNRNYKEALIVDYLKALAETKDDSKIGYCGNQKIDPDILSILNLPINFYPLIEFDKPSLWAGAKGAITPMHMDGLDNFIFQCAGVKRWTLAPLSLYEEMKMCVPLPEIAPNLHLSEIDFRNYLDVPDAIKQNCHTIEVNAGDFLYLPAGIGHYVETLETGVMINLWLNKEIRIPAALEPR